MAGPRERGSNGHTRARWKLVRFARSVVEIAKRPLLFRAAAFRLGVLSRWKRWRSADRDAERLAEREVLLADAEDDELLQLVRRRHIARKLRLARDDLLRDLEVRAEQESCTGGRHVDGLD